MRAYLSIYEEYPKFTTARTICKERSDIPEVAWSKRFGAIQSQLFEFDNSCKPQ